MARFIDFRALRELNLFTVMERLGCKPFASYGGTAEYRLEDGRKIAVTPHPQNSRCGGRLGMFQVWNGVAYDDKIGGAGAINLWISVTGCSFQQAVAELDSLTERPFRESEPLPQPSSTKRPKELPIPAPDALGPLRAYLAHTRKIPPSLLEPLIREGTIYPNRHTYQTKNTGTTRSFVNAVFLMRHDDTGEPVGSMVRGCYDGISPRKSSLPFQTNDGSAFWIGQPLREAQTVVLTESPIECLSWLALHPDTLRPHIRTYGGNRWRQVRALLDWLPSIVCAFNNDFDGNRYADELKVMCEEKNVTFLRDMPVSKDWNEDLKRRAR